MSEWITGSFPIENILQFDSVPGSTANVAALSRWAYAQPRYKVSAKEKFTNPDKADIYLVAYAMVDPQEWAIVSMERSSPQNINDFKLPDVCRSYGVHCIRLEDMFRELNETY